MLPVPAPPKEGVFFPLPNGRKIVFPSFPHIDIEKLHFDSIKQHLPFLPFRGDTTTPGPTLPPSNYTVKLPAQQQHLGQSLFCWALMLPDSYERVLLDMQFQRKISLFACEEAAIYSNEDIVIPNAIPGVPGVRTNLVHIDLQCEKGGEFGTALNTDIFIVVWRKVVADGWYSHHDYTVKVDPDAVFMPDRLRVVLQSHPEAPTGVYLNNCKFGMHGPLEVFSRNAVNSWTSGIETCVAHFNQECSGPCQWGEDMFIDQCLNKVLHVRRDDVEPGLMLLEDHCDPPPGWQSCQNAGTVAFHPFKTVDSYQGCLAAAQR